MSAGRSKAIEYVLGVSNVDSCEGSQLLSHIQQREAPFTDRGALWATIKIELFACVRLPGVLSGSNFFQSLFISLFHTSFLYRFLYITRPNCFLFLYGERN